jgi:nitrate reductase delta subunit
MSGFDPLAGLSAGRRDRSAATRALKDLVRKHFDLDEAASIFVAEIACAEADCPDTETIIALFLDGGRQEFRIFKPVSEVTGADVAAACAMPRPTGSTS